MFFFLLQVYLKSQFIFNGVCVIWKGWIDLCTLNGVGSLEFDQERAQVKFIILKNIDLKKKVKHFYYTFLGYIVLV